ncbi:MAG: DEAD/DEAH box helicase [Myxococcota bacterium]|nr:DEAD/DEAH box helicase [Myxococcota bacterium]
MHHLLASPFTEALSTLNDRALRRLLGARAYLRGYDYVRRRAVDDIVVEDAGARGHVRGNDAEPYKVTLQLTPSGFSSSCTCPAFASSNGGHCKHVAALLIALRDQARGAQQRHGQPSSNGVHYTVHGGTVHVAGVEGEGRRSKRARARAMKAAQHQVLTARGFVPSGSGVDAWLPEPMPPAPKQIEYRLQVKQVGIGSAGNGGALTITLLDPDARVPLLPSTLLVGQDQHPTADREAIRLLARFENQGPRRVGIDVRGEDASDLLPLLKGRRVIVEPQMMELRFGEEPLRPRFDLELSPDGAQILVRTSFQRQGDPRRFTMTTGAWFEGSPGWYVDAQEGWARPIDRRASPAAVRRLLRMPMITEPVEKLPDLVMQGLPRVALEVGAELPELSQVADVVDHVPTFRVAAGGALTEAQVSLRAAYEDVEVDVRADGMTVPVIVKSPEPGSGRRAKCIRCDIVAQQAAAAKLRDLGLVPAEDGNKFTAYGDNAIRFWTEGIGTLPDDWDLYVPDDLVDVQVRNEALTANARVSSGVDWLSVRLNFESDGVAVTQDELARCLAEGRRYVRLADGTFARLDPQKVREVLQRQAEILATGGGNGGRLPLSQAGRVEDLLAQVGRSNVSADARELFHKLKDIDEIKGTRKPRNLRAQLRPYQEQGFQWLWFLHEIGSGGVLADDMGLGKTVQALALLLAVKNEDAKIEGKRKPFKVLIVAPTSVVTNWLREMDKFAPSLRHALWHGAERKERQDELEDADVVVTSYALLRRDEEMLKEIDWRYVILDEAQQIKNPMSATARAAKRLRSDRRLALSGTPIENRLSEIWSIFDFVSRGLLGPLDKFEERYSRPIDAGDRAAAQRLRATIHPFILRRTKAEVARDLPEKIETDQFCELTGEQAALYAAVLKEVRAQVMGEVERQGLARSHIQILVGLTRLRQAACDPRLLGLPREFGDEDSGKLVALRDLVQTSIAGGHKVLVFSQFVSMLQLIKRAMDEDGVKYEYLDGSTKDRAERVDHFQRDDGPPVFLISLKAGGSGLNLTAADTVIHFDPWWNPAVEDQATDRAHRIGQTKVVTTYRLIAKGTIEEKILELAEKKRELVGAVLTEDIGGAKKLTKGDLEDLFKFDN